MAGCFVTENCILRFIPATGEVKHLTFPAGQQIEIRTQINLCSCVHYNSIVSTVV